MKGTRKELPRCQYGVSAPTEEGVDDCGDPAVASWDWGEGLILVCDIHDQMISDAEDRE